MYALWLARAALRRTDPPSLRLAGFGGAPMAGATIEGLRRTAPAFRLFNAYGSTRDLLAADETPPGSDRLETAVRQPLPCADIRVMDRGRREGPRTRRAKLDRRPDGRAALLENPQAHRDSFVSGLLEVGRHRHHGCRRLPVRARPQGRT
jgi:acyl-coenzyme A synthetase/AMP-(fatty) acid ligase